MLASAQPAMEEQQARLLRGFLLQLERQEAVEEEAPSGFAGEFARLKIQSTRYRTEKTFPTKVAEKQDNIKKNRYKDIVPFDHSRVRLTLTTAKHDTDYINASFIKGVSGSRAYIATQGPLPHTVLDFLRMLWEYDVKVVVMACREFEMAKKKSERYWPQKQEQPFVCEPFTVYCDSEENKGDYLTRILRLTHRNCSRTLTQLHYVNWPDHGVPDAIPPILEMLQEMRSCQDHDDVPICIHCSAGCGRTGALCAIDYTWNLLKKQMITPDFNIYDLVHNMRTQRHSLVQTKEQYELVYRTIKILFQRYLQSLEAQKCKNEVTTVLCAVTPDAEDKLLDLSPELVSLPELQHLQDEEREDVPPPQPLPQPSEISALRAKDMQMEPQQRHLLRASPDVAVTSPALQPEGPRTSPTQVPASQGAAAAEESGSAPSLDPLASPAVEEAVCLMVEDPYFDTSISSLLSEAWPMDSTEDTKQSSVSSLFNAPALFLNDLTPELITPASDAVEALTDEEAPPPLPERTPESYVLAVDTERSDPCDRLSVIIPPNAAAEAVRGFGGSPPSPVPPLPERTPESFELDIDQAPVEQIVELRPVVILNRIGTSSEWSGHSKPAASAAQRESNPWVRSKSLKVKMTFTVPVTSFHVESRETSDPHPVNPPLDPPTPPLLPHTDDRPTPSLPGRSPESFILNVDKIPEETSAFNLSPMETQQPTPRAGRSHEWDGNAQPKKFLDVVMSRSKSVRAKGSMQEPLTAAWHLAPPPVVVTGAGSAQVEQHNATCGPSLGAEAAGNNSEQGHKQGLSRTRSLKFFRHKQKSKLAPPPPLNPPAAPPPALSSLFKFGFGKRFRKPNGPRSYPESWF